MISSTNTMAMVKKQCNKAMVDPFEQLHLNAIALVVEFLNPVDIIRLQRVSQNWNSILGSEYIARIALLAHFPQSSEAIELVDNNARGKAKDIREDDQEKPVKRRRKNKIDTLSEKKPAPEVIGFRRATFRLHTRALAKPSKVHKYRLHHVSEKSFAATSTHLFWAEANKNIWVQSIGEGVGGRRSLKLKSFGDTIAHLYQIAATEAGLVIALFREVGSWGLILMALEHQTDTVIWKINPGSVPISMQVTSKHVYYTIGVRDPALAFPPSPNIMAGLRSTDIYVHSLETGKLLHKAVLQTPVIGDCTVIPGTSLIYPPAHPTKIFATYDVKALNGACRTVVRVFTIDGTFLHRFDLDRPAIGYRAESSLRFIILPATRGGVAEKIMVIESTSRPHLRQEPYMQWDNVQSNDPVLSAWIVNPDTHEVEEIRRYFSTYAENEKVPNLEGGRVEAFGGESTRLECLDVIRGVSYIYYDENKKKEPDATVDEDQHLNGAQPVRWYENCGGARIDSVCYEEQFSREVDTGIPIKQEHFSDVLSSTPPLLEGFPYNLPLNLMHAGTQPSLDWRVYIPIISGPYNSPLGSPSHNAKSAETKPQATWKPVVRHFLQSSRHKLVQPDIMRRRRRPNLGEEEEDWQLLPVKTGPMLFMDVKSGGETPNDGRFVFCLAKCSGWSITCFVLDFQPEW